MPTTFTHDLFGRDVYKQLPKNLQEKVRRYGDLYRIGLHGPDILFYYRIVKNPVNQLGTKMHQEEAGNFFARGLRVARDDNDEALLVYLLGFACHFLLDSTCHPYIRTLTDKKIVSHGKVEKELDRLLMIREGKDPYHYYPSCAIVPKHSYARTIHKAIWQISSPTLYLSLKWMKRSTNLMVYDDNGRKQKIILPMLKAMGMEQSIGDNFMRKDMDRGCMPMLEHLLELYQEALANSSDYIIELFEVYRKGGKVPTRFNRNYE